MLNVYCINMFNVYCINMLNVYSRNMLKIIFISCYCIKLGSEKMYAVEISSKLIGLN